MFGIASYQQLDSDLIKSLSLHPSGHGEKGSTVGTSWSLAHARDVFDSPDIAAVSDSEIYNERELAQQVEQDPLNQAYLIAMMYRQHGFLTMEKLSGRFSFCILDKKNQKLIVVTDRYGINPVVYSWDGKNLIFGSRIKEILSAPYPIDHEIDCEAVVDYMNFEAIPTPKTIYKNIRKLPPGHFLLFDKEKKSLNIEQYYDITYSEHEGDEQSTIKKIPPFIENSVRTVVDYELAKGKSIGAFLSGGTDSSTVTGMIKKLTGGVKTFSIGFDEPGYSELDYARITAKHFGAEHYEYMVTPDDVLKGLDIMLNVYDEPFANASTVPTYYCALMAKRNGVSALIGGDGGDEIFGGNERYATNNIFRFYTLLPSIARKGFLEPVINGSPSFIPFVQKGKKYIKRANIPQPDRFFSYNPVTTLGQEEIFSPDFLRHINGYNPNTWARELYSHGNAEDELNKLLYIDMKFTITDNDIRKVTAMSESTGIRVAYPLLDHRLVDFAATIPPLLKVKGRKLRYVFKEALRDFLPEAIIRKKKHGFGLPIGIWIKTKDNISSFVRDTLLTQSCTIRPFFKKRFIEDIFTLHKDTGFTFYGDILWYLLIFELWNKSHRVPISPSLNNAIV
jgi:asparagine synthase (glutamine-hydrolysing)